MTGTAALTASFEELTRSLSGPAGIAVVPIGGGTAWSAGELQVGAAWSTSKVPVAIAALQEDSGAATMALVRRAITSSDNAAAEALWSQLGSGEPAATKMAAVLRAGGDAFTRPQAAEVRPPYTAFGQTMWRLPDAAGFAAHLPCMRSASTVYALMGQVEGDQQWGLGHSDGAHFKGGWGPSGTGYLVRQLGVVATPQGQIGIAIMVSAPTGFAAGTADLDRIAGWVTKHAGSLGGGHC